MADQRHPDYQSKKSKKSKQIMDLTLQDEKGIKTLEDYAVILTTNLITLLTLQNLQVRALEIGILKEEMNERATSLIWDLRRLLSSYQKQLDEVLSLLPDDFNMEKIIKDLQEKEMKKARSFLRNKKSDPKQLRN